MTPFQKLLQIFKPKQVKHIRIDEDSVREHNMINALANENAELKGERAKLVSELGKYRQSKQDKEDEQEVRWELNERKKELQEKNNPTYFSFKRFFNKLRGDKKLAQKLAFYSFNNQEKLAKFGDIGFSSDGNIVILSEQGEVILSAPTPNRIFFSPGGLGNDVDTYKMPICVTPDGKYIENILDWKPAKIMRKINGKFQWVSAEKKPLYDYLAELNEEISNLQGEIAEKELTITNLQKQVNDLQVSQRVAEDLSETSRAELSQAEKEVSSISRIFRGTERELSQLRDTNVILEDNLEKLENQLTVWRDKSESEENKNKLERAIETVLQIRGTLKRDEPKAVNLPQNQSNQQAQT